MAEGKANDQTRTQHETPQSAQTSLVLRPRVGHLVLADTSWADKRGLASVCDICGGNLRCHSEFIPAVDGLVAGGIGRRAYPHRQIGRASCRERVDVSGG